MGLIDAIKNYRGQDGLVTPVPCEAGAPLPQTGNNLYTWLYFIQLVKRGEARAADVNSDFNDMVRKCFAVDEQDRPVFGLVRRAPYKPTDQEGPDDYLFLAYASKLMNTLYHAAIYRYGRSQSIWYFRRWIYNNAAQFSFSWSAWLGRMPQLIAHLEYCMRSTPNQLKEFWWCISIATTALTDRHDTTAHLWAWCMTNAHENKNFLSEIATSIWYNRMRKEFPGGINQVICDHLSFDHPLTQYWVD